MEMERCDCIATEGAMIRFMHDLGRVPLRQMKHDDDDDEKQGEEKEGAVCYPSVNREEDVKMALSSSKLLFAMYNGTVALEESAAQTDIVVAGCVNTYNENEGPLSSLTSIVGPFPRDRLVEMVVRHPGMMAGVLQSKSLRVRIICVSA